MRRTPASGAPDPPRSGAARSRFSTVRAAEDWLAGRIDRSRVQLVPFGRLMDDFEGLMGDVLHFVGHPMDDPLQEALSIQAERQRTYRSPHRYDLAKFGLTESRIRADTARFSETFLG